MTSIIGIAMLILATAPYDTIQAEVNNSTVHLFLLMVPQSKVDGLRRRGRQEEAAGVAGAAGAVAEALGPAANVGQILEGVLGGDLTPIFAGSTAFIPEGEFREGVTQILQQTVAPAIQRIIMEFNKNVQMHFNSTSPRPNQQNNQLQNNNLNQFQQPNNQFQQPNNQFQQQGNQFQQPINQFQQPNNQFQQPINQFQQPNNHFQQPNNQFQPINNLFQQQNQLQAPPNYSPNSNFNQFQPNVQSNQAGFNQFPPNAQGQPGFNQYSPNVQGQPGFNQFQPNVQGQPGQFQTGQFQPNYHRPPTSNFNHPSQSFPQQQPINAPNPNPVNVPNQYLPNNLPRN